MANSSRPNVSRPEEHIDDIEVCCCFSVAQLYIETNVPLRCPISIKG